MKKIKKIKHAADLTFGLSILSFISAAIITPISPVTSIICFGVGFCSLNVSSCFKQYYNSLKENKNPEFEPFPNPNGVSSEQYIQNETENNKTETKQEEIKYNRLKVVKTYIKNRYNNLEDLQK